MGSYNYQVLGWPAQPRSKKRREANIAAGGGTVSSGGGGLSDMDLSGYIRIADLIKTTSDASVSEFLDTNAMSSLMVKTLLDQKANTIHDHATQLVRPAVMVVPQQDPSDAGFSLSSGEVAEFISNDGSFAGEASSVTPADLKDLVLKVNGVTQTTYNPASAASFNVDLSDYALKSWVEAKNYLQGITKSQVEAVLTGNITSHTHSQYLTSHQSLADYYIKSEVDSMTAKTTAWDDSKLLYNGQGTDAKIAGLSISSSTNRLNTTGVYVAIRANSSNPFIGLNQGGNLWYAQAASGYFYFGPTSAKALRLDQNGNGVFQTGSVTATAIIKAGGTSSQFLKADGSVDNNSYLTSHQSLADYALKSEIPTSMPWSSITGRPTSLSSFADDSTHRLVTDSQISAWSRAYGEFIIGTQTAATGTWTGVSSLATASDLTSGYRFTYWLPYAGSGNATLTLTFVDGTTKTFNLYSRGGSRLTTHFPAGSKIDFVYLEGISIAGSATKYTGAWPDAYYDTTYSAGSKALFDAGTNTSNRVWSASVLASAVAAKVHSHLWSDITDRPLNLSDFTNDLISSWALAASKPSYSWSEIGSKPDTLSGFGITDGYSSLSTTGSGNAITGVSGSGHALTFTKGNTFVDLASEQTISGKKHIANLDVTGSLAVPQVEPTAESGKVFEYISSSGDFGESASAVTPADLKDLVLKVNGVTQTTYNPASAASFNVELTDYALKTWVESKNYLQSITKTLVEAVLTGDITSHTHSQYLTSHQSLSDYYTKTQADARFLTSHQSLADYALKSEIPTSMAWTAIMGKPTKLSDFINDIISSWALTASKPDYTWSEIGSKPTSLSGYGISDATSKTEAIPYIVGPSTDTTAGTWTGTYSGITAYTDGLTIIYVPAVAGASTTTLNINGLGAKTCYFSNTSKLTTHYSVGTPILFTYRSGYWRRADYNTNSDTLLRVYRQTSGYNDDYPILVSRTKTIGTAGSNSSYTAVYGVVYDTTQQPTVNPYTGEMKVAKVTATTLQGSLAWSYLTGKPTNLSDFTNDIISSWALAASKPAYTLDEVTDGSSRKLSDYMLSSSFTKSAITTLLGNDTFAPYNSNGYLPLNGGTLTGGLLLQANQTFDVSTAARSIYYTDSNNVSRRAMIMNPNGVLAIGYDLPSAQLNLQLDGYSTLLSYGSTKNYSLTLNGADGTIRSSVGANLVSLGYRSGNTIYPLKHIYSTFNVSTKCIGAISGTVLYGVARFTIANTKKARTFAIKIPSGTNATTFKIIIYSSYNTCPSSTITVSTGGVNLTSSVYCALYPSYSVEGSFAGRVAFARDGDTSSSNMYILLGNYSDGQQYQSGMIAIDSIIHSSGASVADTVMNFGYELLDLDSESMFTKITECVNADAHFKSVSVTEHVTAPKIDCTNMFLVPASEPSSVPAGKVAEYIDINSGSFAN